MRRHRRERQILVFGLLLVGIAFVGFYFAGVYRGDVPGPFSEPFVTPPGAFESTVNVACPPTNATPLKPTEVALRVFNGTDKSGLAGTTRDDLKGRGFVVVGAANWSRAYKDSVRILYGEKGLIQAYTLSNYFNDFEMILDNRDSAVIDLVLGDEYDPGQTLRSQDAAELDPERHFTRPQQCVPIELVTPDLAPRTIPDNPLATASPEPSTSPSAEGDDK